MSERTVKAVAEVVFKDVDKVYANGVQAVKDLSLEAHDGEFLVLVGPSGCGKTTALRMVAGLEEITDGELSIGGRVVNDLTPKERDVAMVFQNYALYPHLSVAENIAFGLRLRKTPKKVIDERVVWAAKLLDLVPYLGRRPKELSGGQRQRVAMGRAIVRQPQAFLMDEPLSNLDAKLRVQMRADISRLQRDLQTTTIYVTHDQVEAMTMGDRVAVMSGGVLQQVDAPQRLFDNPANLFVAGFIGTPPMNLIQAGVRTENGAVTVGVGDQQLPLADQTLSRYPGVRGYAGRQVVLGIRSDDLHPTRNRPELPTLHATLELLEALGSQSMAYFRVDAETMRTDSDDLEDEVEEDAEGVTAGRPNLVATFAARDALGLKVADDIPLGVDVAMVHLFDAETGAPLR
jgi:multiple sugar transport system ATP-binding protein